MSKTEFILNQPLTMSAHEVVELGKKQKPALKFSEAYVYSVRASAKKKARPADTEPETSLIVDLPDPRKELLFTVAGDLGWSEAIRLLQERRVKVSQLLNPQKR